MKKKIITGAVLAVGLMMSSCAVGPAAIYSDITAPVAVTSNSVGTKVGTSQNINVLGIAAVGDAGINEAAKNGGITKISHVDVKIKNILWLFNENTTTVYGE